MFDRDLNVIRPTRPRSARRQKAHLRECAWWFAALIFAPFAVGFAGAWTMLIGFLLLMFALPVVGAYLIIALVLGVKGARLASSAPSPRLAWATGLAAPLLTVATFFLAWPALSFGSTAGDWTRLMINLHRYEALIAQAHDRAFAGETGVDFRTEDGIRHTIDYGPPVRVAFNPDGIIDNWTGVVFDPTGELMQARGFDGNGGFTAPDHVKELFGGDLVSCRRLWRDYYTCSFT